MLIDICGLVLRNSPKDKSSVSRTKNFKKVMHVTRVYVVVTAKVEKPISLTKPVSHQQLANLSKALESNWRRLGSLLGIPEQRLENLSSTNKLEHNKGKKMLYEWKKTIDAAATKDLQEKLKKMGMGHLVKLDKGTLSYDTEGGEE